VVGADASPSRLLAELVAMANARGGHDNITASSRARGKGSLGASEAKADVVKTCSSRRSIPT
jgi:serine/threonine protein phosphatase PrpC